MAKDGMDDIASLLTSSSEEKDTSSDEEDLDAPGGIVEEEGFAVVNIEE